MSQSNDVINKIAPCDVLYITEDSSWGEIGFEAVREIFPEATPIFWSHGMPKPDLDNWCGQWILSFKSDLIIPLSVIEQAKEGALNFHPAPPKYRGIGGYWWALQNMDHTFGVTCHHMNERIDYGDIIKVDVFPIKQGETEESLKQKSAYFSVNLFKEILHDIANKKPLEPSGDQWHKHLYTSKELEEAKAIAEMPAPGRSYGVLPLTRSQSSNRSGHLSK
ncbi:MAG: formyltransferase family protein [Alphaproteobacteria bacterium]|nr:formyltransferase family protein [Alphaproteobacteria bacterium]